MQVSRNYFHTFLAITAPLLFMMLSGCELRTTDTLFRKVSSAKSGISFNNTITETDSLNILNYEYLYNGGGVGVGDVNNDGLQDIFFTGNTVPCRLFLNRGSMKFEDVTSISGIATRAWCTGVAMVDINQDGLTDIYISTAGPKAASPPNLLYVNKGMSSNGYPVFEEMAFAVGLADSSFCVQSVFLDYDLDGDLDVYLLTNFMEPYNRNTPYGQRHNGTGNAVDRLYMNEGFKNGMPHYTDVSTAAGILSDGWGLGVVVNDINRDGYPDIYVTNDFMANDHLYINNKNGTFSNEIANWLPHQEHDGMGVDITDINNDGLNDLIALDMMPEDNVRQKAMFSNNPYDRFQLNLRKGYQPQYVRNVLQLNNGNGTFSDIGYMADVYATDWSWSALFADVDNDSFRDLFITNGFRKDITDLDFVSYSNEAKRFGGASEKLKRTRAAIERLEGVRKPNCMYRNNGDLTFRNKALAWGLTDTNYSTGAVYADLDNDGDLDLVVSNINEEANVYENILTTLNPNVRSLSIQLIGRKGNREGVGAKIWCYAAGKAVYAEHQLQRGYQSSVDPIEHIGLGAVAVVDSIRIEWPGGATQVIMNNAPGFLRLYEDSATVRNAVASPNIQPLLSERHSAFQINCKSTESDFVDYKQGQPLLLHKYSQDGPGLAVGDIDGNGLEDLIVGGPANRSPKMFLQKADGTFSRDSMPLKPSEDMGLLLFDADGDKDLDLYCVSGSTEFGTQTERYQDRLYANDGEGHFTLLKQALPAIESSGSCVVAADYDKDGDLDLFVGGRISPGQFPVAPRSYVLQNDGRGQFVDITVQVAKELAAPGMVSSALWTDFDGDGWTDLIVAGEWMPVLFYKNVRGKSLLKVYESEVGWWNSISGGDVDNDGDVDYVLGNLGLNSLYKASAAEPVSLYAKDFDKNGSIDPIVTRYIQGQEYPTHYRESMTEQMVYFRRRLPSYAAYGRMSFAELLPHEFMKDAMVFRATCLSSSLVLNEGKGVFKVRPLPKEAQFSPLYGTLLEDVDLDGDLDILGVGNSYASETGAGYYDAGIGVCLSGDGKGNFESMRLIQSGFFAPRDAKGLALLQHAGRGPLLIVSNNSDSVQVFEHQVRHGQTLSVQSDDVRAELTFKSGITQVREFYYGSGYLSQGSRLFTLPLNVTQYTIWNTLGEKRTVSVSSESVVWNRR